MQNVFLKSTVRMLAAAAALAGVSIFGGGAGVAEAQSCYQGSPYILDICGTKTLSTDYEWYAANAGFYAFADGVNYLVFCQKNDLTIFDVTNPLSPGTVLAGEHIPFDWTNINTGGDTHGPYVTHIRDVATSGGFRYALVPLGEYGWDFLHISGTGTLGFVKSGFHPTYQLASPEYTSAALFSTPTATYAVAQKLDQASINNNDNAIKIYQIGTATELTAGLGVTTIQPLATVPTGTFATPIGQMKFWVVNNFNGSTRLLLARRGGASPALLIADITDPAAPTVANTIPNDSQLFGGAWGVDEGYQMVWVADRLNPVLHQYALVNTLGIPGLQDQGVAVTWWGTGTETVQGASVSVAGNLLVAGAGTKVGYLSLAGGGTPVWLEHPTIPYTDLSGRVCLNSAFSENVTNVAAFQVAGQHYVCRSMSVDADIVGVSASCISTIPLPDFRVTGGSASATCAGPAGFTQADAGFPGDTFTITDQSAGVWDTATLDIQHPLGTSIGTMGGQTFPLTITTHGQGVPWTPPASTAPGDYYVVLSIAGGTPPSTTKVISLCGNPQAVLTVTVAGVACANPASCTALIGDTVTLGNGGTTGNPSGNPTFLWQLPPNPANVGSTFTPGSPDTFTVGVVVPYGFPGSPDATCTGNALFAGFLPTGTYASCAVGSVAAGYGTASFQVEQPSGNKVADATSAGSVNVAQPVTLRFKGRIATAYTPSFQWVIPNLNASALTCTYTAPPYQDSTCTIPGNTLPAASAQQWNLTVNVCSAGGLGSPPAPCTGAGDPVTIANAPAVTVTPLLNSIAFTATPSSVNVGQTVTITLGQMVPSTGYDSLTIDYGGLSCDGVSQSTVRCTNPFGQYGCGPNTQVKTFSYAASEAGTTKNIQITGYIGTNTVVSPQVPVTVGTSGSCPCPAVTVTISGPTSAQRNQTVAFTGNVVAGGPITSWSWTFGDGGSATGQTVTHAWSNSGTYTVRVTATSNCGSSGSANLPITIGGGGGGNLTITPSPSTVDPGAQVTFTFSPAVTRVGDSLTFNFGDGTPTQTISNEMGWCTQTNPCNTIRYSYTRAGTFTVTVAGIASGTSVSGSTQVVVRNNCQATAAPAASFSFAPAQVRAGEVVHFTDTSSGTPTAWAWNFGGQGTTATIPVNPASLSTLAALTMTPNPTNPGTGQSVTFTFSPAVTQAGDSVTFDFGDGSAAKVLSYLAGLCSPATPCNNVRHAFSAAGAFTITGSGTASGQPVSGSVQLTVTGGAPLTITASPANALVGQSVTFNFSPAPSQAGDTVTLTFGDGSASPAITYPACGSACSVAIHTYSNAGTYTVTGSGTAGGAPVSGTTTLQVATSGGGGDGTSTEQHPIFTYANPGTYTVTLTATNCLGSNTTQQTIQVLPAGPDSVIAVDAAKVQGLNGTDWHADLRIYNASAFATSVTLQFLAVGQDNTDPFTVGPYQPPLPPKATLVLDDILQWVKDNLKQDFTKTALRVTYTNDDNIAPVVLMRTYNRLPDGSKYGQVNSGVNVLLGTTPPVEWLTGLHSDGLTEGFRTNYSLVNLQGDPGGVSGIDLTLFDAAGTALATKTLGLAPYGYVQDSIKKLFGDQFETIGPFSLKIDIPQGKDVQTYASVMDNHTGDPVMIQAEAPPNSPVYLPAIGHLNGLGGTVWRSDFQITNPDGVAHTWEVRYTPKPNDGLQPAAPTVTVEPHSSIFVDDLVRAVYDVFGQPITDGTQTSGIVRVAPADGSNVYPIVAARAYNQTANGTFGQGIPPLWAAKGVAAGEGRKLVLAGMSSDDIARTNVGFVNLSETDTVNFLAYFYDQTGTPLNPVTGQTVQPLSISVGPGLWDQDKLENRFRNAFHIALPSNLTAVSAEIFVSYGGPGFAYATVIDSKTGDPNFVPAVVLP